MSKPLTESVKEHEQHPVYSDFTHVPDMSTMAFAVTLREEPGSDILKKILPLTKIIPKEVSPPRAPKPKKNPPKKKVLSETCEREDCMMRLDQLAALKAENDGIRLQQKSVELNLEAALNKKSLIEKSIQISSEKNETVKVDIESVQARIESIEVELDKGDDGSEVVKQKMELIQEEIEKLKQKIEKGTIDIERLNESKNANTMKFSTASKSSLNQQLAEDIRLLDNGYVDDSDDD